MEQTEDNNDLITYALKREGDALTREELLEKLQDHLAGDPLAAYRIRGSIAASLRHEYLRKENGVFTCQRDAVFDENDDKNDSDMKNEDLEYFYSETLAC